MNLPDYPRAFVAGVGPRDPFQVPQGLRFVELGSAWLAHADDAAVAVGSSDDSAVAVVGIALDPDHPEHSNGQIARGLAEALDGGEEALRVELGRIGGRYAVVAVSGAYAALWTDSCGLRATYWTRTPEGAVVASHARLLAEVAGRAPCPEVAAYRESNGYRAWHGARPLPGLVTPWADVFVMPPNQRLDLRTGKLQRVGFDRPLPKLSTEQAADVVIHDTRGTMRALSLRAPVALSITGGVDSRCTLACSREIADRIQLFTYRNKLDLKTGRAVAKAAGLPHVEINSADFEGENAEHWKQQIQSVTWLCHKPYLIDEYRTKLAPGSVHVRSTYGQGRGFYRLRHGRHLRGDSARDLAQAYMGLAHDRFVVRTFQRFIDETGFDRITCLDPLEALYTEHRMPQFHALVFLESDFALDAISPMNGARVRDALLGHRHWAMQKKLGREAADVCRLVTQRAWPEIAHVPYQ